MVGTPYNDRSFGAFLFDMDGTLLDSIAVANRVWGAWATRNGLDVEALLSIIHGKRAVETIAGLGLPGLDPVHEAACLTLAEIEDLDGVRAIAGAHAFLDGLPEGRWAVVTSAPRKLAAVRLEAAGFRMPPLLISGEDVERGKPAPDCFLLAALRLKQRIEDCLVFEDAPAGIGAAEAAGAAVLVISATHASELDTLHPSVPSYEGLAAEVLPSGDLRLREKLQASLSGGAFETSPHGS